MDPDLFSGLLGAVYTITEEISESGGIETMELKEMRLLYGCVSEMIFIIAASKDEDISILRRFLSTVSATFMKKYGSEIENFAGNVGIFQDFKIELNRIIERMRPLDFVEVPIKLPYKKRLKLNELEFTVLSMCDGETSVDVLASKMNMSEIQLMQTLRALEKKKIIERKIKLKQ